jgi:hypothetical protein
MNALKNKSRNLCRNVINFSSAKSGFVLGLSILFFCMSCHAGQSNKPQNEAKVKDKVAVVSSAASVKKDTAKAAVGANNKIIVFYFHGNMRCPTCYKLETYAKSEVESAFAGAIKTGMVEWKTVNVDEKENEHFNADYKLYTKSVIVSMMKDGKELSWKNLDKIWELVHEEGRYREYIRNEVQACLEGKCL